MSADSILGMKTPCGWTVIERINSVQHSGGNFCVRYLVKDEQSNVAFLKAMDLSRAFKEKDRLTAISNLIGEYMFERDILNTCKAAGMPNVVSPISAGEINIDTLPPPDDQVYYIIFEKADSDIRQKFLSNTPISWDAFFKAIKHTCLGLEQLHGAEIAHQDIKPSNILNFENGKSKVSDLGRVVDKNGESPFCKYYFAGDVTYAPIEVRYRLPIAVFTDYFFADLSGVGSLIYQTLTGVPLTGALVNESTLIASHVMRLPYKNALPIHVTAFYTLMERLHKECCTTFEVEIADLIVSVLSEMCHPNIDERGSPKAFGKTQRVSFRRYTSRVSSIIRLLKIKGFK